MRIVRMIYVLALTSVVTDCWSQTTGLINWTHLEHLCQDVIIDGVPCTIIHIYSDAPAYNWTDAANEGISCIDDVARAAVLYMRASILTKDFRHLRRIRRLLAFVLRMQAEDGTFYNFIHKDFTINRSGRTSKKLFGFWAARGYWALATGYVFFKDKDPEFAAKLRAAFLRCLPPLRIILEQYGRYEIQNGVAYPTWLIGRFAADATSEFMLGATEFLAVESHPTLLKFVEQLAEGLVAMQVVANSPMRGAFYSWPGVWHAWGNAQLQALARLVTVTGQKKWLSPAERGARGFLAKLLAAGWIREYNFTTQTCNQYPQIAYDVRTTALGFLELYRATGDSLYAKLAGLAASWLTGNNSFGQPIYDPASGRGYDGIDEKGVNLNAGAESTIEALYTLVEIINVPQAKEWLHSRSQQPWDISRWSIQTDLQRTFTVNQARLLLTWQAKQQDVVLTIEDEKNDDRY